MLQRRHIHRSQIFRLPKRLVGQRVDLRISSHLLLRGGNLPRLPFLLSFLSHPGRLFPRYLSEYTSTVSMPNDLKICTGISTSNLDHPAYHYKPLRTGPAPVDLEG